MDTSSALANLDADAPIKGANLTVFGDPAYSGELPML
jgi:hypothetical protein